VGVGEAANAQFPKRQSVLSLSDDSGMARQRETKKGNKAYKTAMESPFRYAHRTSTSP
jgi:hypothetical protein